MQPAFTCRAILFDLDGTLIDSSARVRRLWQWWAESRGVDYQSLLGIILGRTAIETVRLAAPHLDAEAELAALEHQEVTDLRDVRLYPCALGLLDSLRGTPWAIVTSGTDAVANARISHLGLPRPPVLVTASHIAHGKPAPDAFLLAASQLAVPPEDCIVVEDAPVGVSAGKAAGMRVVAIASTHPPEALQAADAVIPRLSDLRLVAAKDSIVIDLPPHAFPNH